MRPPSLSRPSRRTVAALVAVPLLPLATACGRLHGSNEYTWHGTVPAGAWVRVRNTNGAIRVARASGPEVVITATRTYRGRRPAPVRLLTERRGTDVVACVAWAGTSRCGGRSARQSFWRRLLGGYSSTDMSFVVALPPGVRLDASTVNGRVTVADAASEVVANSVNGSIVVGATGGPVRATTVNGGVSAQLDALDPGAKVALESVNGSVTALLPRTVDASLDLSTVNGRLTAAFPGVTIPRGARSLHATLGAGGRTVSLHTVNGSVRAEPLR